jgi:hypothetical protein
MKIMGDLTVPYFKERDPQKLYSQYRLEGKSMREAALKAGFTTSVANKAGERLEPPHTTRIRQALEHAGVTTNHLANVIKDGLSAVKVVTSPTEPDREVTDYGERRQYTKLALEAMGELDTGTKVAVQIVLPNVASDPNAWGEE